MPANKFLAIYLRDHAAASVAGIELIKRCAAHNQGTPLGDYLQTLLDEVVADQKTLTDAMRHAEISESMVKKGVMWLAERAGRLKLNGQLMGYSPLSRVVELEGLQMAMSARFGVWQSLKQLGDESPILTERLDELTERCDRQRENLKELHAQAALQAFADSTISSEAKPG